MLALHTTHVLTYPCVLGSCIQALAAKAVLTPTTTWHLYPRHPIKFPTVPVSLCPRVMPHEGTEPVHVCGSLHVVTLACLCVVASHVYQQLAHHFEASIPHVAFCITYKLLMGPRCHPHETTVSTCSMWGADNPSLLFFDILVDLACRYSCTLSLNCHKVAPFSQLASLSTVPF